MRIPQGVILLWLGNEADIPQGWSRESLLDNLFPKGWGNQAVNQTGGSETHTHNGLQHTHQLSDHEHYVYLDFLDNVEYDDTGGNGNIERMCGQHRHEGSQSQSIVNNTVSATINWANGSNIPPYKKIIFIKADGVHSIIRENIAGLFNGDAPYGWSKPTSYNQKFLRGANTGEDAGGEGGSYTHTHDLSHNHVHSHHHTGKCNWQPEHDDRRGDWDSQSGRVAIGHDHNYTLPSQSITYPNFNYIFTSQAIQPIFKKLLIAYRTANGILAPRGLIALWLGDEASVPKGWVVCDGRMWSDGIHQTPDLRNYFIKLTTDPAKVGETDDSDATTTNAHDHSDVISHTHGAVSHNHGGSGGSTGISNGCIGTTSGGGLDVICNHTHNITQIGNANVSLLSADLKTDGNPVNNEPPYRTVIFIQLEKVGAGGSAGAMML